MAFARERCLPADITLCPTDWEVGRGTDATAIRTPKPRPGILGRHRDGRKQRQKQEQEKSKGRLGIAIAVQHRTSEAQNGLNSSSEGVRSSWFPLEHVLRQSVNAKPAWGQVFLVRTSPASDLFQILEEVRQRYAFVVVGYVVVRIISIR